MDRPGHFESTGGRCSNYLADRLAQTSSSLYRNTKLLVEEERKAQEHIIVSGPPGTVEARDCTWFAFIYFLRIAWFAIYDSFCA